MRSIFLILIIVKFLSFVSATEICEKVVFKGKEELLFKLSFLRFTVGEERVSIEEREKDYLIKSFTKSSLFFFYKVNNKLASYISKDSFLPYYFEKDIHEGRTRNFTYIHYSHPSSTLTYAIVHQKIPSFKVSTITLKSPVLDFNSLIYYLRSKGLACNKELNIVLLTSLSPKECTIKVREVAPIYSPLFKRYIPVYKAYDQNNSVIIWFSKEPPYFPIQMKIKISLGYIKAKLVKVENK
jgi:hypothetical protein